MTTHYGERTSAWQEFRDTEVQYNIPVRKLNWLGPRHNGRFAKTAAPAAPKTESAPAPIVAPAAPALAPAAPDDPARTLADAVRALAAGVSPAEVAALRESLSHFAARVEALESRAPTAVQYKIGENVGKVIPDARPELGEMVQTVAAGLVNLWVSGPAGSGKSTLAQTLSDALGRPYAAQSFSPDVTSAALVGSMDVSGEWRETEFVRVYETGGVYLLDEIDAADPSVILCVNSALANGHLYIPRHPDHARRGIIRHPDTVIVAAANTWGTGPDAQYCGRAPLDAAFLDRFCGAYFAIGYDRALETALCPKAELRERVWRIRAKVESEKIRRCMGTRAIIAAARLSAAGLTEDQILARLTVGWTAQELAKIGGGR